MTNTHTKITQSPKVLYLSFTLHLEGHFKNFLKMEKRSNFYPRRPSVLHSSFHSPDRPCSEIHSAHFTLIPEIQSFPTLKASEYSSRAKTKIGTVKHRPDSCLPMATKAAPSHHKNPLKDCKSERRPKSILLLMFLPEQMVCFPLQLPFA